MFKKYFSEVKFTVAGPCVVGVVLLFQNCAPFETLKPEVSELTQSSLGTPPVGEKKISTEAVCEALRGNLSAAATVSALQSCIDNAPANSKLLLPAKVHPIDKTIIVSKTLWIATEGIAYSDAACLDNNPVRCAELRLNSPFAVTERAAVRFVAPNISVDHLVVNGNKDARMSSVDAQKCAAGDGNAGTNIQVSAAGFTAHKISSLNALCSTAFEGAGMVADLKLTSSYIANAGTHNKQSLWADGVTIHDSKNAIVTDNEIVNSTDVDLIFGGCENCVISNNTIRHTDSFEGSSFAGLMLHAWPNSTSGNYNNSQITNNTIDCGNYRCGFGLLIGATPWYDAPAYGGTYSGNVIRGAQVGFAINEITGPVTIGENTVAGDSGRFSSSAGVKVTFPKTMTSASATKVTWTGGASAAQFQVVDYNRAILNWWQADWASLGLGPSGNDATQTYITAVYRRYLEREPDPSGLSHWFPIVKKSKSDFVYAIVTSAEFNSHYNTRALGNADYVALLYRKLFQREVDPSGHTTWTNHLNSGKSRAWVVQKLVVSAEGRSANGY